MADRNQAGLRVCAASRPAIAVLLGSLCFYAVAGAASAPTQPADAPQPRDPLATKQQIVRDRMAQLEDRMFRLTEKLAQTEPEQAKRLELALRQARERLIRRNMDETIQMLEQGKLTDATDREAAITRDLEEVLKVLLEDPDNSKERQDEIERLQAMQQQVRELLEAQRKLKQQADAAPRLEQLQAAIRAAIARLETLIDRQQKAIDQASAAQADAARELQDRQRQLRLDAESLAQGLQGTMTPPGDPASPAPGASPSAPEKATEPTPANPKPEHPGNEESASPPPAKAQEGSPSEGPQKPAAQDAPNEASLEIGMRQAGQDVADAAGSMQQAEKQLEKQSPADATRQQKKAIQSLRGALDELRKQEISAQQQLDQAEAAKKQRELQKQTEKLANQMKGSPPGGEKGSPSESKDQKGSPQGSQSPQGEQQGGQQGGKSGEQKQSGKKESGQQQQQAQPPAPGAENVEKAGDHMDEAADDLEKEKNPDASAKQQKAIDQLEQARKDLEDALDQKRREQQEEILRGLEARFRAMLDKQLAINKGTDELIAKGKTNWAHAEEVALAGLSRDETHLAEEAGKALLILKEEGSTIVFPRIVTQLQEDMQDVSKRLGRSQADAATQATQAEIVSSLKELIESIKQLRKELEEQEGQSSSGGSQAGNQPLLPDSAELKLLRSCQERVNRQTAEFQKNPATAVGAAAKAVLARVAERQREVAEMARKMNERITGQ